MHAFARHDEDGSGHRRGHRWHEDGALAVVVVFYQECGGEAAVLHLDERGFESVLRLHVAELAGDVAQRLVAGDAVEDLLAERSAKKLADGGVDQKADDQADQDEDGDRDDLRVVDALGHFLGDRFHQNAELDENLEQQEQGEPRGQDDDEAGDQRGFQCLERIFHEARFTAPPGSGGGAVAMEVRPSFRRKSAGKRCLQEPRRRWVPARTTRAGKCRLRRRRARGRCCGRG